MLKLKLFLTIVLVCLCAAKINAQSFSTSADTVYGTVHACPNSVNLIDTITATASVNMWWHVVASNFPGDWMPEIGLVDNSLAYSNTGGGLWDGISGGYKHTIYPTGISAFQFQTTFATTISIGTHWIEVQLTDTVTHYSKNIWFMVTHTTDVVPPASGVITGPSTVCLGSGASFTDAAPGGTWSSTATGIATINSAGILTTVATGTTTISYTVINSCGTAAATTVVTVATIPDAGTITGTAAVCTGGATTTLSDAVTGGTWSSATTAVATIGSSTGIVTSVSPGTSVISYVVTNTCGTAAASLVVTVNTMPVAIPVIGVATVCAGGTTILSDGVPGGVWSSTATAVGTVDATGTVTGVAAGTTTISYTITNSCGSAFAIHVITVNPLPDAGVITGVAHMCPGITAMLSNAIAGGTWISTAMGVATISSMGVVTSVAAGTATISYSVSNSCGTTAATQVVTVVPLPDAGAITGLSTVCDASGGGSAPMSASVTGGTWLGTNSHAAIVGNIVTGISAGVDTIYYIVSNTCGSDTASHIITIISCPDAITSITSPDDNLVIYPNPVATELNISAGYDLKDITITNLLGQIVYNEACNSKKLVVHIANLPAGMYFVKVNAGNSQKHDLKKTFMKE